MINNEKNSNEEKTSSESGIVDTAFGRTESHILIKDTDTNEVLVNKRG